MSQPSLPSSEVKELFLRYQLAGTPQEREEVIAQARQISSDCATQLLELLESSESLSFLDVPAQLDSDADIGVTQDGSSVHSRQSAGDSSFELGEQPGSVIGPYKLLERIGEGGMGIVFMARQTQPIRRLVALKIIKPGMDTRQVVSRFEAERQALAMMDHPNIARVLDAGTTDRKLPYFVMELVKGVPVTQFCNQKKLSTEQRLRLFIDVCRGVQHAHQKGIIHRDLKPSNAMVTLHDGQPVAKIIDFGIAKAVNQDLTDRTLFTQYSQLVGTPLYMSPEQAEPSGLDVDTRSDIYSLGVLLYELPTGTTPFDKETFRKLGVDEVRRVICEDDPPRPSTRVSTLAEAEGSTLSQQHAGDIRHLKCALQGDLDWIVMKALEKDRTRRYETANGLVRDIERHLNGEPVEACPPSVRYRFRKFAHRNKGVLLTATTIGLAMVIAAGVSLWQAWQATQARKLADERFVQAETARVAEFASRQRAELAQLDAERERAEAEKQKAEAVRQRNAVYRNLYYADIRQVTADWAAENVGRFYQKLEYHLPRTDREDLRGWEWYYMLSLGHHESQTLFGHGSLVESVSWSADGRYLASASHDGTAKVWHKDEGRWQEFRSFRESTVLKRGIDWAPDSKRLAWGSVGDENAVRIWNMEDDQLVVLSGHGHSLTCVRWSPDGRWLASGAMDESVRVWDAGSHTCRHVFQLDAGHVNAVAWSPDGSKLAAACTKGVFHLLDPTSGERLRDLSLGANLTSVSWSPNGQQLAFGCDSGHYMLVDTTSWEVVRDHEAHDGTVNSIAWNPAGDTLASGGGDGVVRLWDVASGDRLCTLLGHREQVQSVAWQAAGEMLATASMDHQIKVWKIPPPTSELEINAHEGGATDVEWLSRGRMLASRGRNGKCILWNSSSGEELSPGVGGPRGHKKWNHDGSALALLRRSKDALELNIIDTATGETIHEIPTELNASSIAWSPDGVYLAVWERFYGGSAEIWEVDQNRRVAALPKIIEIASLCWAPDSRMIAVSGRGQQRDDGYLAHAGWVYLFDIPSGTLHRKQRHGNSRVTATAVAWSPDGQRLVSGDINGLLVMWDAQTGRELARNDLHRSRIQSLDWTPDSNRIASGGRDGKLTVIDGHSGEELLTLGRYDSPVTDLAWDDTGMRLAAAVADGKLHVWDASLGYAYTESDDYEQHLVTLQRERADHMFNVRNWVEALEEYERYLQLDPSAENAWNCAGIAANQLGRTDDAMRYYGKAIELAPRNGVFHGNRVNLFAETGRWQDAEEGLAEAIRLQQEDGYEFPVMYLYQLALVQARQSDLTDYRSTCRAMVALYGEKKASSDALPTAWSCVLAPDAVEDFAPAIDAARQALVEAGESSAPHYVLGGVLYRAGSYKEALEELRRATQADAEPTALTNYAWYLKALVQQQMNQTESAREALNKAVAMSKSILADKDAHLSWRGKLTFEILRKEVESKIGQ